MICVQHQYEGNTPCPGCTVMQYEPSAAEEALKSELFRQGPDEAQYPEQIAELRVLDDCVAEMRKGPRGVKVEIVHVTTGSSLSFEVDTERKAYADLTVFTEGMKLQRAIQSGDKIIGQDISDFVKGQM